MAAVRLVAIGGKVSDVGWLKGKGFDEVGLTVNNGENPSPAFIHNAGITYATLNPWNDSGDGPGTSGDKYAGYMQAIKSRGWNHVAGEGRGGDVIRVVMNTLPYLNFGGIVNEQQYDMYASPWSHPSTGPHYHVDYIEIYDNNRHYVKSSCLASMRSAQAHGSKEVGILIGNWQMIDGMSTAIIADYIDSARAQGTNCNTVCWWAGLGGDICSYLKGGEGLATLNGIRNRYGVRYGIGGGGGVTPPPPGPVHTPHLWLGIDTGSNINTVTVPVGSKVVFRGRQGYVDSSSHWIPNGKLTAAELAALANKIWTFEINAAGTTTQINQTQPNAAGAFAMTVTHSKIEKCQYYVKEGTGETSKRVLVNWAKATTPPPKKTPTGTGGSEVTLTPVSPIPGEFTEGLTVVLRDHKKKEV